MNLFVKLEKSKNFWFLLTISLIFFFLRLPSLFEPYWYGDEGIYQTMAVAMNNGSLLYRDIWDNKPPLLYILYALFDGDQFSLRLISLLVGIVTIIAFFFLLKKINGPDKSLSEHPFVKYSIYITTFIFAFLFAIPLFEGNIANTENFMILFPILAGLCIFRYLETKNTKALWYAGFLLSFETLFKVVGIFDFATFTLFLFILQYKSIQTIPIQLKIMFPFLLAFVIPIILTVLYFFFQGILGVFISATLTQMVGYVGYGNVFFIPQGLLYVKIALLLLSLSIIFYIRSQISQKALLIYLWLIFAVFSTFFSQRPYPHYVLMLLPSFCLFVFLLLGERYKERTKKLLTPQTIHMGIFILLILLVYYNFNIYRNNVGYYQNFIAFMQGSKSLDAYQRFFDANVPRDYAIAQFLRLHTKPDQTIFLWGNSAQIYKMSNTLPPGRYTVEYHISTLPDGMKETAKALSIKKPRFIVIMSSNTFPFDLSHYRYVFSIYNSSVYEYTF